MEFEAGRWRVRLVGLAAARSALRLRGAAFRGGRDDLDRFDADSRHLLIEGAAGLAGCARVSLQSSVDIARGYTAMFYDLGPVARTYDRALEVGRICLAPGLDDPEVARLLLASLARIVEVEAVDFLYGCASFPSAEAPLGALAARVAPAPWAPRVRAPEVRPLTGAAGPVPPLLRAWLGLGARVSDHAVVDRDLGRVHVFCGLPIAEIRPERARLLTGMLAA